LTKEGETLERSEGNQLVKKKKKNKNCHWSSISLKHPRQREDNAKKKSTKIFDQEASGVSFYQKQKYAKHAKYPT
jgi:hypothetical protein